MHFSLSLCTLTASFGLVLSLRGDLGPLPGYVRGTVKVPLFTIPSFCPLQFLFECVAHTTSKDLVAFGNARADAEAKLAAFQRLVSISLSLQTSPTPPPSDALQTLASAEEKRV